ncbi:MAG: GNAT family N-acetyltransferase [Prevotella sp.]|nr:GNAT family N-acetyltransferase [Prevotella sp.]
MSNNEQLPVIRLRAMEPEDLDLLYLIENDREVWNVGVTNVPYSRYVLRSYIAESSGDIYTDRQVRLMVENEEGETVGIVDLLHFDPSNERAEVGIVICNHQRQKGYASATLKEVLNYAHTNLHLHQLYAYVATDNERSLRLFGKYGFESFGVLRDWLFDGSTYHDAVIMQFFFKKTP